MLSPALVATYPFSHVKSTRRLPLVGNPRHETHRVSSQIGASQMSAEKVHQPNELRTTRHTAVRLCHGRLGAAPNEGDKENAK